MEQKREIDHDMSGKVKFSRSKNPWKPIFIYVLVGYLWVLFSDQILAFIVSDYESYMLFQSYKGTFYVLATAVLLFFVIRYDYSKIVDLSQDLSNNNRTLRENTLSLETTKNELKDKVAHLNDAMNELLLQKQFSNEIFNNSTTAIIIWNMEGEIIEVNNYFRDIFGFRADELRDSECCQKLFLEADSDHISFLHDQVKSLKSLRNIELKMSTKENREIYMLWNCTVAKNPNLDEMSVICFGVDLTSEKLKEKKITELAYKDQLTKLDNLIVFQQDVDSLIAAKREFNLFFLDLDNFRHLNDIHGHDAGNMFIRHFASTLKNNFPQCRVYRWGGDEFMILDFDVRPGVWQKRADQLLEMAKTPWYKKGFTYHPSASIGVVEHPLHGNVPVELIKNIDLALHESKSKGKNRATRYQSRFQKEIESKLLIESSIREMLENDCFMLNYQPIYQLDSKSVAGVEVLLRWSGDSYQFNTGQLISVAEETGQILEIDRWVIENAFDFFQKNLRGRQITLSINISAQTVESPKTTDFLVRCIEKYHIEPKLIEFELTEHSLINNLDNSLKLIKSLKDMGFHVALDDFGTKYSSFNYLINFPFDRLKIDKSYIDNITTKQNDMLVVHHLISLAKSLGIATVAEGVEARSQYQLLEKLNCNYVQGYFLSKPVSQDEVLKIL